MRESPPRHTAHVHASDIIGFFFSLRCFRHISLMPLIAGYAFAFITLIQRHFDYATPMPIFSPDAYAGGNVAAAYE